MVSSKEVGTDAMALYVLARSRVNVVGTKNHQFSGSPTTLLPLDYGLGDYPQTRGRVAHHEDQHGVLAPKRIVPVAQSSK